MSHTLSHFTRAIIVMAGLAMGFMAAACDVKDDDHQVEQDSGNVVQPDAAVSIDAGTPDAPIVVVDAGVDAACPPVDAPPPVNHTPMAVNDIGSTTANSAITVLVLANDTGLQDTPITMTVTNPSHGTAVVNPNLTITYTPSLNFVGTDSFGYTVRDADGQASTATVSMTVEQAPPPAGCTTNVQCNNATYPFIVGTCVGPTVAIPVNHCEWQTVECDQLVVDVAPGGVYITPWGTHGAQTPDVELPHVMATPGTLQYLGVGACSARAYDANWHEVPMRFWHMWNLASRSPLLPFWTLQQSHPGLYLKVTFDGANLVPAP